MRAFLRAIIPTSLPFEQELVRAFTRLGRDAATSYLRVVAKAKVDDDLVRAVLRDMDVASFPRRILRPTFERHYVRVAGQTLETINDIGFTTGLPDAAMRRVIAQGGTRAGLVDVRRATYNTIFRIISESRAEGRGVSAVARLIRDQVPAGRFVNAGSRYRAQLIARTETKYAQNVSAMEAYRAAAGINRVMAFDAQGSGASDEECQDRDGQVSRSRRPMWNWQANTPAGLFRSRRSLADASHPWSRHRSRRGSVGWERCDDALQHRGVLPRNLCVVLRLRARPAWQLQVPPPFQAGRTGEPTWCAERSRTSVTGKHSGWRCGRSESSPTASSRCAEGREASGSNQVIEQHQDRWR